MNWSESLVTVLSLTSVLQVDGHGNFGSIDDDPPAAMRYTECRLAGLASDMLLSDLDSETVDFLPTFDGAQVDVNSSACLLATSIH